MVYLSFITYGCDQKTFVNQIYCKNIYLNQFVYYNFNYWHIGFHVESFYMCLALLIVLNDSFIYENIIAIII